MNRRKFLIFSSSLCLPFSLSGCVIPAVARKEEAPLGGSWADNARQAQALFAAANAGAFANPQGIPFAAVPQRNGWLDARGHFQSISDPTFSDAYALSRSAVGYFAAVNSAVASGRRSGKPSYRDKDGVVVMPGDMVSFNETGYCMDPTLPAPGRGELLRLVPTSSLVPDSLRPVYESVLKQASRNDRTGAIFRENMQRMVWMFRTAGQESPYMAYVSPQTKQMIDAAHPNGWNTLSSYHRNELGGAKLKSDLVNAIARGLNLPVNTRPADFADHQRGNRIVDEQLQTLINTPVGGQVVPGSQFTLLAPGVAAEVVGSGPLQANFRILNQSGEPFRFSPAKWSAESQRQSQRVAYAGDSQTLQRTSVGADPDPDWGGKFLAQARDDYSKIGVEKALAYGHAPVGALIGKRRLAAPILKTAIDSIPLLGNSLAIYEAVSGKSWMTGEPLDAVDHALAVVGTIPGASTVARLGSGARGAMKVALEGAAASKALRAVDRSRLATDIIDLGNTDATRALVERAQADPLFQQVAQKSLTFFRG